MTKGFLIFAYNNEEINYGLMAIWQARRIKKWLGKTTSLITDRLTAESLNILVPAWESDFDVIHYIDSNSIQKKRYVDRKLTFHNLNRIDAYKLSPYDETIVLDVDVIIQTSNLNKLWGHAEDLVVCDYSCDIFDRRSYEFEYVSEYSIKFFWATIFFFRKGDTAEIFFDHCKHVKDNYLWNKHVYNLQGGPLRNDFIWSIALHTLGGSENSSWVSTIPWNTPYIVPDDNLVSMTDNCVRILSDKGMSLVKGQDLHVMNKFDLMKAVNKELGTNHE